MVRLLKKFQERIDINRFVFQNGNQGRRMVGKSSGFERIAQCNTSGNTVKDEPWVSRADNWKRQDSSEGSLKTAGYPRRELGKE